MERDLLWLWLLSIKGLGPVKINSLLGQWTQVEKLYYESESQIFAWMQSQGHFSKKDFISFCQSKKNLEKCRQELTLLRTEGVEIISRDKATYPEKLRDMVDGPPAFFMKGRWPADLSQDLTLAVVGTRRVSRYGKELAGQIGRLCGQYGITLISGMAAGVDGIAHRACLKAGGYSIGVLASGLGYQFPATNRDLYLDMEDQGALITEESYQTPPLANLFPKRNRIISGLGQALIVVEAAARSGSLITADYALDQGRDIYAVPGRIGDLSSAGCNHLISQGAYILENIEDFFIHFTGKTGSQKMKAKNFAKNLEDDEKILYACLSQEPTYIGRLLELTGMDQGELQLCLLQLEWKGYIEQVSPGYYVLAYFSPTIP